MSQTLAAIITQVRSSLEDPNPPVAPAVNPDWSDANFIDYWNLYVQLLLFSERPDASLADNGTLIQYSPQTDPTEPVLLDDRWIDAGMDEMRSHAYEKDGAAKRNNDRAIEYHQKCLDKLHAR